MEKKIHIHYGFINPQDCQENQGKLMNVRLFLNDKGSSGVGM